MTCGRLRSKTVNVAKRVVRHVVERDPVWTIADAGGDKNCKVDKKSSESSRRSWRITRRQAHPSDEEHQCNLDSCTTPLVASLSHSLESDMSRWECGQSTSSSGVALLFVGLVE